MPITHIVSYFHILPLSLKQQVKRTPKSLTASKILIYLYTGLGTKLTESPLIVVIRVATVHKYIHSCIHTCIETPCMYVHTYMYVYTAHPQSYKKFIL